VHFDDIKGKERKFSGEILKRSQNNHFSLQVKRSSKRKTKLDRLLASSKGQLVLSRNPGIWLKIVFEKQVIWKHSWWVPTIVFEIILILPFKTLVAETWLLIWNAIFSKVNSPETKNVDAMSVRKKKIVLPTTTTATATATSMTIAT